MSCGRPGNTSIRVEDSVHSDIAPPLVLLGFQTLLQEEIDKIYAARSNHDYARFTGAPDLRWQQFLNQYEHTDCKYPDKVHHATNE